MVDIPYERNWTTKTNKVIVTSAPHECHVNKIKFNVTTSGENALNLDGFMGC